MLYWIISTIIYGLLLSSRSIALFHVIAKVKVSYLQSLKLRGVRAEDVSIIHSSTTLTFPQVISVTETREVIDADKSKATFFPNQLTAMDNFTASALSFNPLPFGQLNQSPHLPMAMSLSTSTDFSGMTSMKSSIPTTHDQKEQQLTIVFLKNEIKLSDETLTRMLLKYSWVFYLRVDRNLRPKIDVLRSFGFREKDIRSIITAAPSILGIEGDWTLPEKLISLQKMFFLSKKGLVSVIVKQPFLLTCSIDRNIRISNFLTETIGFSGDQVRKLVGLDSKIPMTSISILTIAWDILTNEYGIDSEQARKLCQRYPRLLSRLLVEKQLQQMKFFKEILLMNEQDKQVLQQLVLRYPPLLLIDVEVFLIPNVKILQSCLQLNSQELHEFIKIFPQLLGHSPETLQRRLDETMRLFTGLDKYQDNKAIAIGTIGITGKQKLRRVDDMDDYFFSNDQILNLIPTNRLRKRYFHRSKLDIPTPIVKALSSSKEYQVLVCGDEVSPPNDIEGVDVLREVIEEFSESNPLCDLEVKRLVSVSTTSLHFDESKAVQIIRAMPWILSYKPERNIRIIASLVASLDLSQDEITRCISLYPR